MGKFLSLIKKNKKSIALYLFLFLLLIILSRASIVKRISPFGFSFAFSLILLQKNAILVAICYFLSAILFNLSIEGLIINLVTASSMILLFLVFKLIKKKINLLATIFFLILSQAGYLYFSIGSVEDIFVSICLIAVAIMFVYISHQTFSVFFFRGISSRLTVDESICLSLFLIALFSGLEGIYIGYVQLTNSLVALLILFSSRIFKKTTTIYLSLLAGFGMAFSSASVVFIAIYATYGVLAICLADRNKFFAPVLILLSDVVFGMFLNAYAYYSYLNVIPLLCALIIYLCFPKKVFEFFKGFSFAYDGSLSGEFILSGQKEEMKSRLEKTSALFKQMQSAYSVLSLGEVDRSGAADALKSELFSRHCKNCVLYESCFKENIQSSIKNLFEFGLSKGKVSLIDADNLLTGTCRCLTSLIEEVNQSLKNYFEYEKSVKIEDNSKALLGEQLGGTSEVFDELSALTFGGEKINEKLSLKLLDELTINQLVANEVVILEGEEGVQKVVVVIKNSDALSPKLGECLRSVLKINFKVVLRRMTRLAGWSIVCFAPASRYKVQIGYASEAKEGKVSGDTYSIQSLGKNRFLFALSDGMGHGARANQISTATLGLVETFYKAGFSSQTIINSVNRLLLPTLNDDFSCLDACIVDTTLATADFIKVGSSISLVKSENETRIVEGSSPPLGIIKSVKTVAKREILKDQDIIVLASDGVVDSFASFEEYMAYVNNERMINVQMLADSILEEATSRAGDHKDDMSIITIKICAS